MACHLAAPPFASSGSEKFAKVLLRVGANFRTATPYDFAAGSAKCAYYVKHSRLETIRMPSHPPDPNVDNLAPTDEVLTPYDDEHISTYLRMLDAEADNADWREVAAIVLHINPEQEPERARRTYDSHLARAKWMANKGYRHLLKRASD
jgi:hypothetical protein